MSNVDAQPLCSIGIPTYNRPTLLAKTIEEVCNQSYRNLEIIISDNASTDADVARICDQLAAKDSRVRLFRQSENIGPRANFEFVFQQAKGEYFMWAADDDRRSLTYVQRLVAALAKCPAAVLCGMETCYETEDGPSEFFRQCDKFYTQIGGGSKERILNTMNHLGAANIIYGMFRRTALLHKNAPVTRWIGSSLNELPLFVLVANKGEVICLPEVGLWKRTSRQVVEHVRWEVDGGIRRKGPDLRSLKSSYAYHKKVMVEIDAALETLDLSKTEILDIRRKLRRQLTLHAWYLVLGWKPKIVSKDRNAQ